MNAKDNILTQFDMPQVHLAENFVRLFPPVEDFCRLTMVCRREQYAASVVARAVEDCDAHLLNLNVTDQTTSDGEIVVELRVGVNNGEGVARSLARYGYEVVKISYDAKIDADVMSRRIDEILHYIEL